MFNLEVGNQKSEVSLIAFRASISLGSVKRPYRLLYTTRPGLARRRCSTLRSVAKARCMGQPPPHLIILSVAKNLVPRVAILVRGSTAKAPHYKRSHDCEPFVTKAQNPYHACILLPCVQTRINIGEEQFNARCQVEFCRLDYPFPLLRGSLKRVLQR